VKERFAGKFEVLAAMPEGERTMMSLSKAIKAQLGVDVSRSRLQEWRTKHLWDGKLILATRQLTGTAPQMLEMMQTYKRTRSTLPSSRVSKRKQP
jgi:hypothetical protein